MTDTSPILPKKGLQERELMETSLPLCHEAADALGDNEAVNTRNQIVTNYREET